MAYCSPKTFSQALSFICIFFLLNKPKTGFAALPASMVNDTTCAELGIDDVTIYQYNLPVSSEFGSSYSGGVFFPVFSSSPLDVYNPQITQVFIAIHGLFRNADDFFCLALVAARQSTGVLVIGPWFGASQVSGSQWQSTTNNPTAVSAYWADSNWMSAADNSPMPYRYTSSFGCLDAVVIAATARNIFPNVNSVVVTGFSAGGQTVQRYSWATSVDKNSQASGWHMRFITSDPSSYAYLDSSRPAKSCYPLNNTGVNHTCSSFILVNESSTNCSTLNQWKWGLTFLSEGYLYLAPFAQNATLLAEQTELMRQKDTRYILGAYDCCNCNLMNFSNQATCYHAPYSCLPDKSGGSNCCDSFPDSTDDNAVADDCASNLQGSNRLQRGLIFMSYLGWYWAAYGYKAVYTTVPHMEHNATQFFFSKQLADWAFESQSPSSDNSQTGLSRADIIGFSIGGVLLLGIGIAAGTYYYRSVHRTSPTVDDAEMKRNLERPLGGPPHKETHGQSPSQHQGQEAVEAGKQAEGIEGDGAVDVSGTVVVSPLVEAEEHERQYIESSI